MDRSYRWALVVLVLVFSIAAIIAYQHNHQRALSIPTTANLAGYQNSTYGYSFYYPPEYTVRVASDDVAIIGMGTADSFTTYVEARIATTSSDAASYDEFIVSATERLCNALPGFSCGKVAERSSYTSEMGLAGVKLYLDMTAPGGASQRFGPVYAFNIGANVDDAAYAALLVYRPQGAEGAVETFPAESVAGKVQITKAEKR